MTDDRRQDQAPDAREAADPVGMARRDLQKSLPRRFYTDVSVGYAEAGGATLHLDGKPVRTPAKALLVLPSAALATALALEWQAQTTLIDPSTMPLTKLANSAIDGVTRTLEATAAEVAKFAETDLTCYRVGDPQGLVDAQSAAWDPVLAFARDRFDARFICVQGVMFTKQPESAVATIEAEIAAIAGGPHGAMKLAALSVMTSLMGSVLLALAVAHEHLSPEQAWTAAHVDEEFQMRRWGADSEAIDRRARRWSDMAAAALTYRLSV